MQSTPAGGLKERETAHSEADPEAGGWVVSMGAVSMGTCGLGVVRLPSAMLVAVWPWSVWAFTCSLIAAKASLDQPLPVAVHTCCQFAQRVQKQGEFRS